MELFGEKKKRKEKEGEKKKIQKERRSLVTKKRYIAAQLDIIFLLYFSTVGEF